MTDFHEYYHLAVSTNGPPPPSTAYQGLDMSSGRKLWDGSTADTALAMHVSDSEERMLTDEGDSAGWEGLDANDGNDDSRYTFEPADTPSESPKKRRVEVQSARDALLSFCRMAENGEFNSPEKARFDTLVSQFNDGVQAFERDHVKRLADVALSRSTGAAEAPFGGSVLPSAGRVPKHTTHHSNATMKAIGGRRRRRGLGLRGDSDSESDKSSRADRMQLCGVDFRSPAPSMPTTTSDRELAAMLARARARAGKRKASDASPFDACFVCEQNPLDPVRARCCNNVGCALCFTEIAKTLQICPVCRKSAQPEQFTPARQ